MGAGFRASACKDSPRDRNRERYQCAQLPLARQHTTYLFNGEIIIKLHDEEFVQASGKHARNTLIHQAVKLYMKDLSFNSEGLAARGETLAGVACVFHAGSSLSKLRAPCRN